MVKKNADGYAIYMAGHPAFVNHSIIHRLTVNKDKKAILIYGKIGDLSKNINKLEDCKIFDKVIYAFDTMGQLEDSKEKCISKIEEYYNRVFKDHEIQLSEHDCIHVGVDTLNSYGIYLCKHKLPFYYFEGGLRNFFHTTLSRMDSVDPKIASNAYKDVMREYKISDATNPLITCLINPESDYTSTPIKTKIYSTTENIHHLTNYQKNAVLNFYGTMNILEGDYNLIVMSSQWGIRHLEPNEQKNVLIYIYQLIIQYCIHNDLPVLIKPHPLCNVSESELNERFGAPIISKIFPSEYMGLLDNVNIVHTYSVGSAGAYGETAYKTGFFIYRWYPYIEVVCSILHTLQDKGFKKIHIQNIEPELINFCMESQFPNYFEIVPNIENDVAIISRYTEEINNKIKKLIDEKQELKLTIAYLDVGPIKQFIKHTKSFKKTIKFTLQRKKINENYVSTKIISDAYICETKDTISTVDKKYFLKWIGTELEIKCEDILTAHPREVAQLLRDDSEYGIDLNKSIEFMQIAANNNAKWAKTELSDLLLKRSDKNDLNLRIEILQSAALENDGVATYKLATSYLKSIGVEKNYKLAINYLIQTEKNKRCDLLDNIFMGKEDLPPDIPLLELAQSMYKEKSTYALHYLSNCYLSGKGVQKSLQRAIDMYESFELENNNEKLEYVDLLLRSSDYTHHAIAYDICLDLSKHDKEAILRLGIMYFEGKAVKRDYLCAKKYFDQCDEDPRIADLLNSINTTLLKQ